MKLRGCWHLACALLLLCSACGDDDQGTVDPAVTGGERDAGADDEASPDDEGDPADDDDPASTAGRGSAGEGSMPGSDSGMNDAAAPPVETADAGDTEEPSDGGVSEDAAVPGADCASLAACCEQLPERRRAACESAVEAADNAACAALAGRSCREESDGGRPARMACESVLECCAELEDQEQVACEAAAAVPEGRACDRAMKMYCR
jgi:hypothetical protein